MKVNTDGVLLGAWVDLDGFKRILDIGTGTGVIALMAAQRQQSAKVVGVELDVDSFTNAVCNKENSPFSERVEMVNDRVQDYVKGSGSFDHILSNPPYFIDGTMSTNLIKANTRHTVQLTFSDLISSSLKVLTVDGNLSVILPCVEGEQFITEATNQGLHLIRQCIVYVKSDVKGRYLMTFSRHRNVKIMEALTIRLHNGDYSQEYKSLTKDFYLAF